MLTTVNVLCLTGPPPPQNITVGLITVSQISVHWMLTASKSKVGWAFSVRYVDMSTREERIIGMTNISRLSETNGLLSYTAVIGGLESYRKYTIEVCTITQRGIESSGQAPVTVRTGKHVAILLCTAGILPVIVEKAQVLLITADWNSSYHYLYYLQLCFSCTDINIIQ